MIEIHKYDHTKGEFEDQAPCWVPVQRTVNYKEIEAARESGMVIDPIYEYIKPTIVCICGKPTGIGLHHVHADGTVTASYWHKKGTGQYEDPNGCEWHVFIKLLDYDLGEFLPVR